MIKDKPAELSPCPSVTIFIASYERLELLQQAVESALRQRYSNFEIIIVDDGSSADVVNWLREIETREPGLSVFYRDHQGVAAARSFGVAQASTELVCILDSDDLLDEDAVGMLVEAMLEQDQTQLVHCDIRERRMNGSVVRQRYRQYDSARAMTLAILLKPRLPFKHSGTLFRRRTALELGSYDAGLKCKVDIDLYLKFLQAGYLPRHLGRAPVEFRMHKNSVSIDRMAGIRVWMKLIDRYGPSNPWSRLVIKSVRIVAELLKRIYVEIQGLRPFR